MDSRDPCRSDIEHTPLEGVVGFVMWFSSSWAWSHKEASWLVFTFCNSGMAVPGSVRRSFPAHTPYSVVFASSSQKAWRFQVNQNRNYALAFLKAHPTVAQSLRFFFFLFQDGSGKVCHLLSALAWADTAEGGSASPFVTNGDPIDFTQEPLSSLFALQCACTLS